MEDLGLRETNSLKFWHGKRVMITGHTGFKGSWLALWLQYLGSDVVGYSKLPPTETNHYSLLELEKNIQSVIADIRDLDNLKKIINDYKPEIIFHLAAQALVRASYIDPIETYSTNVLGTINLFEAVRSTNYTKVIINVTSDKCYENKEWVWGYRENEPMGGSDPYSSSKGSVELLTTCYQRSYFTPDSQTCLASVRAGNVIGGGDWAEERLVPDIMRAFVSGKSVDIRNPNSIRPWQHVLEPLAGYLQLAQTIYKKGHQFAGGWNFGADSDDAKPVIYIVEKLTQLWGGQASWKIVEDKKSFKEANFLKLDCSKAKTQLGWYTKWNLNTTLTKTVEWYKAYNLGQSIQEYSLKQINEYMKTE
jgi:CDP-glucose 4,6-dehydratase